MSPFLQAVCAAGILIQLPLGASSGSSISGARLMSGPSEDVVASVRSEYRRYAALGEGALRQLSGVDLCAAPQGRGNSVATLVWHISENLRSRFTDFLASDGEKPWRDRDEELKPRAVSQRDVLDKWTEGWDALFHALNELDDRHLDHVVSIRGVCLTVHEALHRSLAHIAYHVGQIIYRARELRGDDWEYLSIPPGDSDRYNRNPLFEKGADQASALQRGTD